MEQVCSYSTEALGSSPCLRIICLCSHSPVTQATKCKHNRIFLIVLFGALLLCRVSTARPRQIDGALLKNKKRRGACQRISLTFAQGACKCVITGWTWCLPCGGFWSFAARGPPTDGTVAWQAQTERNPICSVGVGVRQGDSHPASSPSKGVGC